MATDGIGRKRDFSGNGRVMLFSVGDVGICMEIAVVIKKQVEFDSPSGATGIRPMEKDTGTAQWWYCPEIAVCF